MKWTICLFFILLSFSSCQYVTGKRVEGNGQIASQDRQVGSFTGVRASGSIDIIVSNGAANSLKIEADQNLLEYIETSIDGDVVEVHTRRGYDLDPRNRIKVYAVAPSFSQLSVSGSGKITSNGKIMASNALHADVSGSGDILLDVDAPRVEAEISGSGSATLTGTTKDFAAQVSGSGEIRSFNLMTENTEIDIAGSGNAEIFASKTLNVDVAGAGDVRYKGNPSVKQNIAGAGSVRKVD